MKFIFDTDLKVFVQVTHDWHSSWLE